MCADKIRELIRSSCRLIPLAALSFLISTAIPARSNAQGADHSSETDHGEFSGSATVYLIDKSSSMLLVYDDLRENLKAAARKSESGDSLSIILFGDSTTVLASYRSMDESRRETLARLLDSVYPDSFYTNLALAIKRGTETLHNQFENEIAETYTMVLVTDGKNNPSPDYVQDYTIEEALTRFSDFMPGKQWSLRYIALDSQIDPDLLAAVEKYGESFYDVEKIALSADSTQREVIGSLIENPMVWESFAIEMADQSGTVEVRRAGEETWSALPEASRERLQKGDSIAVGAGSRASIDIRGIGRVGLKENTRVRIDTLQKQPVNNSTSIKLKLEKGTIWNAVDAPGGGRLNYEVLTPIAVTAIRGTVLRVNFDEATQTQTIAVVEGLVETSSPGEEPIFARFMLPEGTYSKIAPGQPPTPPGPIPHEFILEWARWMKSLILRNPFSRINFESVRVTPGVTKIRMGPLKPNKKFIEYIQLKFSKEYFGKEPILADIAMDLPPGVTINTKIVDVEGDKLMKNVLVSLECASFLRYTGVERHGGRIQFSCRGADIKFSRSYVELNLDHSPPGYFSRVWNLPLRVKLLITVVAGVIGLLTLLAAWVYRDTLRKWKVKAIAYLRDKLVKTRLIHLFMSRPSGHMVLLSAPFAHEKGAFDLADISRRSGLIILGIGANGSNPIVLSHPSVQPIHCHIWASRKRNPTRIYLDPCSKGHLTVNGEQAKELRQLQDKDIIEVGDCRFRFMDKQYRHQVKVRMDDNTVYVGNLEYWDINQSVFYLLDKSTKKEKFLNLSFSEVSHVHFFKDESERDVGMVSNRLRERKKKKRKPVKITLRTGRKLRGYVDKKYKHEESTGVFLFPKSETVDIQYTYIPKSSIQRITIGDSPKSSRGDSKGDSKRDSKGDSHKGN